MIAFLGLGAATSHANELLLLKFRDYTQTSDAAPTTVDFTGFFAALILDDPAQVDGWNITVDGAPPEGGGFDSGYEGVPGVESFLEFYDDYLGVNAAQMDSDYPNGAVYCFNTSGGTGGTQRQCQTGLGTESYGNIPYLTGGKFTDLNTLDVTQDFMLTIPTPAASVTNVFVEIYTDDNDETVVFFYEEREPEIAFQTSIPMPGGTLTNGVSYGLFIEFGNASDPPIQEGDISLGGSRGYNSGTDIYFTPTGPPAQEYRLLKFRDYQQTSNAQPASPELIGFFGALILSDTNQLAAWDLTVDGIAPPDGGIDFGYEGVIGAEVFLEYFDDYAGNDAATLNTNYPSAGTEFCFNISGGDAGTLQQCETGLGAENYPVVPYLVGTQYDELSSIDVGKAHTFEINTPTGPADVTNVAFEIYLDDEDETEVFSLNQNIVEGPYETLIEMPADTLEEGVAYAGFIEFASAIAGGTGVISPNNTNSKGHNAATYFTFRVVPEPGAALSQLASLLTLFGVVQLRRSRSVAAR